MVTIIPPKPEYNRFYVPESFRKGTEFENFVLRHLFPEQYFALVSRTPDYLQNADRFQERSMEPDFILRDRITDIEFYVECKYRSSLIANSFQFAKAKQIERYKTYVARPFFIVLGLGGMCETPNQVFLMNFQHSQYAMLYKRHIREFEIAKNTPVASAQLWQAAASGVRA